MLLFLFLLVNESDGQLCSGIDTKNALEILKKIIEEYKDQTMIFSIHQLELLEMMDRVVVMENGSIVFDGTYREYEANYGKE